jgi:hypothetical protein
LGYGRNQHGDALKRIGEHPVVSMLKSIDRDPINRVRSLSETAAALGISLATLRRRIADGTGPRVIQMSIRRLGISDRDREAYIAARGRGGGAVNVAD